jgi:hypothetical protein
MYGLGFREIVEKKGEIERAVQKALLPALCHVLCRRSHDVLAAIPCTRVPHTAVMEKSRRCQHFEIDGARGV